MRDTFLIASAAAALLALPAAAQVAGPASPVTGSPAAGATAGAAGSLTSQTPPVNPMPGDPAPSTSTARTTTGAAAETGMAANTSATEADLKAGATVRDSAGVEVGRISKVTKGSAGAMVTLSSGGKTVTVPASSLSLSEGALTSSSTKADIWAPR